MGGYGGTKRLTEKFFDFHAQASGGKWDVITGNPCDIIGPALSAHHTRESYVGKISRVIEGKPALQEANGRPWMLVDVRDVAEAEVVLAESKHVESGSRFLLSSGDKIPVEDIPKRAMELHPDWDCPTHLAPAEGERATPIFSTVSQRTTTEFHRIFQG